MTLEWDRSYLTNGKQYVQFNKVAFDTQQISCGVPHKDQFSDDFSLYSTRMTYTKL